LIFDNQCNFSFDKLNFIVFLASLKGGIVGIMIIINVKDGESLDKALKRFKKKFEKTGVLRELRSRQAYEKRSVTRRNVVKHAVYKQNMFADSI